MTIKEIRKLTELTQQEFANKYEIPLGTLKQWESAPTASYHRECPIYVNHLLERAVREDFYKNLTENTIENVEKEIGLSGSFGNVDDFIKALNS